MYKTKKHAQKKRIFIDVDKKRKMIGIDFS